MALRSSGFEGGPDRADRVRSIGRDTGRCAAEPLERGELRIGWIVDWKSDETELRVSGVGEDERGKRGERKKRESGPYGHEVRLHNNLRAMEPNVLVWVAAC